MTGRVNYARHTACLACFRVVRSSSRQFKTVIRILTWYSLAASLPFLMSVVSLGVYKHVAVQFRRHKALQCHTLMPGSVNCSAGEIQTDSLQPEGRP